MSLLLQADSWIKKNSLFHGSYNAPDSQMSKEIEFDNFIRNGSIYDKKENLCRLRHIS